MHAARDLPAWLILPRRALPLHTTMAWSLCPALGAPLLQRPFRNEAPVLVETFMHIFCGVDPQQLLDSRSLLEKEQAAQREQEAAAKRAAAKAAQKAAQGRGAAAPARGGPGGRAAAANTAHLPRLPALPPGAQRQLGAGVAAALARGVVPRHVTQAAPSRHAHSGGLRPCIARTTSVLGNPSAAIGSALSAQRRTAQRSQQHVAPAAGAPAVPPPTHPSRHSWRPCSCRRRLRAAAQRPQHQHRGAAQPQPLRAAAPAGGGRRSQGSGAGRRGRGRRGWGWVGG